MSIESVTNSQAVVNSPSLEAHLDLIHKVAWKFAHQFQFDVDDLVQEACLACLRALPRYNPNRGALSTFIWHTSSNAIRDVLSRNSNYTARHLLTDNFLWEEDTQAATGPDDLIAQERMAEFWATLSPEAQEICRMVISDQNIHKKSAAGNFSRVAYLPTDKPRRCRATLEKVLEQRGWAKCQIQSVFREIKTALGTT